MKNGAFLLTLLLLLAGCSAPMAGAASKTSAGSPAVGPVKVLAVESFLADLAQNVAGDRLTVETLIPLGLDPHAFEPTPADVARIAASQALIVNGAGFEEWLQPTLDNAGGERVLIVASAQLEPRTAPSGSDADHASDPHFWFDPRRTITYVENIRDGLTQVDPDGKAIYARNAEAYIRQLDELDAWIEAQVETIPPENRILVTNHESFGYFADRYSFTLIGAILASPSANASPSAQQLSGLVQQIQSTGARAIFLETGSNPELGQQLADETGAKLVTGLYTHSLSEADGPAATYIDMMRYNTTAIVEALK